MSTDKTIAVIGAGISGLTTAYWLKKAGFRVTVYERAGRVGGSILTEHNNGYLVDLGPNSTLETSDTLKNLVAELGLADQKVYGNQASNNRYVVRNGKLHALPMTPKAFLNTSLFSAKAKLRLMAEPFIGPTRADDISLSDFVRKRLGPEFLDYAINPFVAGVYAGDPDTLSTPAAFPKLWALEQNYGSFIKGMIRGRKERKQRGEVAKDRAKLFSFRNGMEVFPQALARELGDSVSLNTSIQDIQKVDAGFELSFEGAATRCFEHIVLCTPTDSLSTLLKNLAPKVSQSLSDIAYPPVNVVYTGYAAESVQRKLDGFGFLIPKLENRQILGSIWSSVIFPQRAPQGKVSFTTFVGGTRQPQLTTLDDEALQQTVHRELSDLVGLSAEPEFVRIKRWPRAIPQYTMGYQKIQKLFSTVESELPGLHFAGNFRRGISVGDSVLSARQTVDSILAQKNN